MNFNLKSFSKLAPNCCTKREKFTRQSWQRMRESTKNAVCICADWIGSKVQLSNYMGSAIFFSQLCFFSGEKRSWASTDFFRKPKNGTVTSQYCLVDCSEKSGKKQFSASYIEKNMQKYSEGSKFRLLCGIHLASYLRQDLSYWHETSRV